MNGCITRIAAIGLTVGWVFGMEKLPVFAEAETSAIVEIPYASALSSINGSIQITLQGEREVCIYIQKKTQEGLDLYYEKTLNPAASDSEETTYIFYLDCCEYSLSQESYVSTYQLVISDPETEAAAYQETEITILDPHFSDTVQTTNYCYTVQSEAGTTAGVIATIPKITVADNIQTVTNTITLRYVPSTKLGDIDGNGTINVQDAVAVLTYYAKQAAGNTVTIDETVADVNQDQKVDVSDAVGILTYYAKAAAGNEPSFS